MYVVGMGTIVENNQSHNQHDSLHQLIVVPVVGKFLVFVYSLRCYHSLIVLILIVTALNL